MIGIGAYLLMALIAPALVVVSLALLLRGNPWGVIGLTAVVGTVLRFMQAWDL